MDALLQQVKAAAASANTTVRRSLLAQLRALQLELESTDDMMQRLQFLNCELAMVRLGVDLKIFDLLSASPQPMNVTQIAEKTSADANLIRRLVRYLACAGYVEEEGQDLFSSNRNTAVLAETHRQAAVHHHFDFIGPIFQSLPDYLKENQYQDVTNPTKTPLHYAYKTDLMPWDWFQTQPEKALYFSTYAASREKDLPTWVPTYPLQTQVGEASETPLFVDVGSGFGQQAQLVRETYPDLKGRVILQDFPFVLDNAPTRDDVEKMPHDFFQPQPPTAQGARFYYLRQVLHDHADVHAVKILQNLKDAMGPDSRILIDEIVMPNTGADYRSVNLDMIVMSGLAGAERTKAQWDTLLESVGLKCIGLYPYNPNTVDAILEVVKA